MSTTSSTMSNKSKPNSAGAVHALSDNQASLISSLWTGYVRQVWHLLKAVDEHEGGSYLLYQADRMLHVLANVVSVRRAELRSSDRSAYYRLCAYSDQITHAVAKVEIARQRASKWYEPNNPVTHQDIQDLKREMPTLGQTAEIASLLGYDPCLTAWLPGYKAKS